MKKVITIFISIILVLVTGCNRINYINSTQKGIEQSEEILRCFDENDIEGLKSLFCEEINDTHNLEQEITEAMEFYKGTSNSYDKVLIDGGEAVVDGIITDKHIGYSIDNIETNENMVYRIVTHSYLVYECDINYVGITYLKVIDNNSDVKVQIGEYIE